MRNFQLELSQGHQHYKAFLTSLSTRFAEHQEGTIHAARNVLKEMTYDQQLLVVKSFQVLPKFRRFIYTHLRESKAKRSFANSVRLVEKGVAAPEPVGYIEFFRDGLLYDSFYVSKKVEYDYTIRQILNAEAGQYSDALAAAARFVARMHEKGIIHLDLSPGNLLIKQTDSGFRFYLVDLNRMKFQDRSGINGGLKNLVRLLERPTHRRAFVSAYAAQRDLDPAVSLAMLTQFANHYNQRRSIIQHVKKWIRGKRR